MIGVDFEDYEEYILSFEEGFFLEKVKMEKYASNMIENSCKKIKELYNNSDASLAIENLFMSLL